MNTEASLKPILTNLESLFSTFNTYFYQGSLTKPVITVLSQGRRKTCAGWCTTYKAWETEKSAKDYYEINICAECLARSFEDIAEVMLHEMAHLYNVQNGIQDCSRNGTYHNEKFKETAERHGLVVEKDSTKGYAATSLNTIAQNLIRTMPQYQFDLCRITKGKKVVKKQSTIRLSCPICGAIARVTTQNQKLICGNCNTFMI